MPLTSLFASATALFVVVLTAIALATGARRWRRAAGLVAGASIAAGGALHRGLGDATGATIFLAAGSLGLIALAFHYALRELDVFDVPPEPPHVLDSGPDILPVDLRDRDDR